MLDKDIFNKKKISSFFTKKYENLNNFKLLVTNNLWLKLVEIEAMEKLTNNIKSYILFNLIKSINI